MFSPTHDILSLLASPFLLLFVKTAVLISKLILLASLIRLRIRQRGNILEHLWLLITLLLVSHAIIDFGWLIKLVRSIALPNINYTFSLFSLRLAWLFAVIEYLVLSFFIDKLTSPAPKIKMGIRQSLTIAAASALCIAQLIIIIFYSHVPYYRPPLEFKLYKYIYFYIPFTLLPAFFNAIRAVYFKKLPRIIAAQLKTLIFFIMIPHAVLELLAVNPFTFANTSSHGAYPFISLSTFLLTYGLYFSARKMMGLRFLNAKDHVETHYDMDFLKNFKDILESLAQVTTVEQVQHITDQFFTRALGITGRKAHLYLRNQTHAEDNASINSYHQKAYLVSENFLNKGQFTDSVKDYLHRTKIIIRDELEFTHFYERNELLGTLLEFIHTIEADIFLPIYDKRTIMGYIIIEKNARPAHQFFGATDRDEMLIYVAYVSGIINLLQHANLTSLMKEQKALKEELYHKHQEINQYKESIRSFLRNNRQRKVAIVFYKNRQFTFGNQDAHELINVNLNLEEGHDVTQAFKKAARAVTEYKTPQTILVKNSDGNKLVIHAIQSLQDSTVIIVAHYPEIADTLYQKLDLLKDPSEWDYALYLETTESGKLINELVPGSGETLLNFKINLLKAALSRKAILLDMPDEDIRPTVEIISHISLRKQVHILKLTAPEKNQEVALKLFGINPLFGKTEEPALLEKLNNIGTLFIENIDLLSIETQNALAEFISYGHFRQVKSERKIGSNVRIICSSPQNLSVLAQKGQFSVQLLEEFIHTQVSLPPLVNLQPRELDDLMDGYIEQTLHAAELKNLLELTSRERSRIINEKPMSLQEFKEHIHNAVLQKSQKKNVPEITINPIMGTGDPEITAAVRLGKQALKDSRLMTLLWNKFKNQTEIAMLLGVNRSSVNRRCKEYNLL